MVQRRHGLLFFEKFSTLGFKFQTQGLTQLQAKLSSLIIQQYLKTQGEIQRIKDMV